MHKIGHKSLAQAVDDVAYCAAHNPTDTKLRRKGVGHLVAIHVDRPNANQNIHYGEKMGNSLEHPKGHTGVFDVGQIEPRGNHGHTGAFNWPEVGVDPPFAETIGNHDYHKYQYR